MGIYDNARTLDNYDTPPVEEPQITEDSNTPTDVYGGAQSLDDAIMVGSSEHKPSDYRPASELPENRSFGQNLWQGFGEGSEKVVDAASQLGNRVKKGILHISPWDTSAQEAQVDQNYADLQSEREGKNKMYRPLTDSVGGAIGASIPQTTATLAVPGGLPAQLAANTAWGLADATGTSDSRVSNAAGQAGGTLVGHGVGKLLGKLAQPFKSAYNDLNQYFVSVLDKNNVPLPLSQRVGDRSLATAAGQAYAEDTNKGFTRAVANKLTVDGRPVNTDNLSGTVLNSIKKNAENTIDSIRTTTPVSASYPGYTGLLNEMESQIRNPGHVPVDVKNEFFAPVKTAKPTYSVGPDGTLITTPGEVTDAGGIITRLNNAIDPETGKIDPVAFDAIRAEVSALSKTGGAKGRTALKVYGGKLGNVMDAMLDDELTKSSNPQNAVNYFKAKGTMRTIENYLENNGVIDEKTGLVNPNKLFNTMSGNNQAVYSGHAPDLYELAKAGSAIINNKLPADKTNFGKIAAGAGRTVVGSGVGAMIGGGPVVAGLLGSAYAAKPLIGDWFASHPWVNNWAKNTINNPLAAAASEGITRAGSAYGGNRGENWLQGLQQTSQLGPTIDKAKDKITPDFLKGK